MDFKKNIFWGMIILLWIGIISILASAFRGSDAIRVFGTVAFGAGILLAIVVAVLMVIQHKE